MVATFIENFDKLHFTESTLGTVIVSDQQLRIEVRGVSLLRGHPYLSGYDRSYAGWLVFTGVTYSSRTVTEYVGDPREPKGFKEPYKVEDDVSGTPSQKIQREYAFEGLQDQPKAWVDNWVVRAEAFEFQITD